MADKEVLERILSMNPLDDSRRFSKLLRCPAEAKEMRKKMGIRTISLWLHVTMLKKTDEVKEFA